MILVGKVIGKGAGCGLSLSGEKRQIEDNCACLDCNSSPILLLFIGLYNQ